MSTTKVQTGVRFEEEMLLKITYIARRNRRSFNAQMEYLAQQCIEQYEKENGTINIQDEDRGRK